MIKLLDWFYSKIESIGVCMSQYAWQKRWCNREKGTGYRKNK